MDVSALRMLLLIITGWLNRPEREMLAYLIEENRVLRRFSHSTPTTSGCSAKP